MGHSSLEGRNDAFAAFTTLIIPAVKTLSTENVKYFRDFPDSFSLSDMIYDNIYIGCQVPLRVL